MFGGAEMRVWSAKFGVGGIQLGVGYEIGGLRVKLDFGVEVMVLLGEIRV